MVPCSSNVNLGCNLSSIPDLATLADGGGGGKAELCAFGSGRKLFVIFTVNLLIKTRV